MGNMTRRAFGKVAAVAGVTMAVGGSRAEAAPASERVRVGMIGVGNRGDQVLDGFLAHGDAEVVAVCDLWQPYLDFAAKKLRAKGGGEVEQFKEYRKMLERKDIDAVVVGTPDHWHALQTIHACQAGKDVYVEKPLSLSVKEGRAMVEAVRGHKRVGQVGIQRRSSAPCREMVDLIRGGGIGKVTAVRAFHVQNEGPLGIGRPADSDPPEGFDWNAWVGPAPMRPYNKNRGLYRFRWFYDYSGGQLTNTGVHYMDMIQWAIGEDAPRAVAVMGGKFGDFDNREVPDTMEAMWTYRSGVLVTFTQINANGAGGAAKPCEIEFRGTKGTVYFGGGGYEVVPEVIGEREYPVLSPVDRAGARGWKDGKPVIEGKTVKGEGTAAVVSAHVRNFLDCVKSRAACHCEIEAGHRSTTATLIGNIALKTRAMLEWDAGSERFVNNEGANEMLGYAYRAPYELPAGG